MVVLHTVAAVLALACGAFVLLLSKGTARHRRLGRIYVAAMAVMAATSFGIYELRDGPSVFHAISVLTLVVVVVGLAQSLWRRERADWLRWHLIAMQISYLMLVGTGVSQFFEQLPLPNDALNAVVFLQLPMIGGLVLIVRSARRTPARWRPRAPAKS